MTMETSRWERLQKRFKNSMIGAVVLSVLAAGVFLSNVLDLGERLKNLINPPVVDLLITLLAGANRPKPLDAYDVIDMSTRTDAPTAAALIYPRGAKISIDLAHNRTGDATITLRGIKLNSRFVPGPNPAYAYEQHSERVIGGGPIKPLVFHVALFGDKVSPAMRVIDPRNDIVAMSKSEENFLDTEDPELFELNQDDDSESIDIEVTAEKPGLYEIFFTFTYSVLGEVKTKDTEPPIWIYYDGH